MHSPIIILGPHGGGTSFVTKLLRLRGLFAGADCNPIAKRKTHESKSLNQINRRVVRSMGITGRYESGRTNQVVSEYTRFFAKSSSRRLKQIQSIVDDDAAFRVFFSGFKPGVWGWKDPRNSLTLPFWLRRFPEAHVVAVSKNRRPGPSNSDSGEWFKNEASDEVILFYSNPPGLTGARNVVHAKFEDLISSYSTFNELLHFCGLETMHTMKEYEAILARAGLEQRYS